MVHVAEGFALLGLGKGQSAGSLANSGHRSRYRRQPVNVREFWRICLRKLVQGDARQLPFSEASFDVVVALDILEHLPEDEISIAEIALVLRPKGRLIVNVPAFQRLFSSHDVSFDHIRRYEPKELPRKLRHAGFSLDHWTYWSFFIFPAVFVLRTLTWTEPRNDTVRNDFDLWLPPGTETVMRFFAGLELFLIHLGIRLPFGVSYFCVSNKLEA